MLFRSPRPPPESATGTGCFVQATAHHHIGQLGWLKLIMPAIPLISGIADFTWQAGDLTFTGIALRSIATLVV